jgi:hypothetical protein
MQTRKTISETLREEIKRRAGEAKLAWQTVTRRKPYALVPIQARPLSS